MAHTTINKSSIYQNTVLYTGNNTGQSITGVGFQPDIMWNKSRSNTEAHNMWDSVRGAQNYLTVNAADSNSANATGLTSFDSDGWTMGVLDSMNDGSVDFAAWCWKAGTTTGIATDSETDITPTAYSFNQTSGVSIVKYTGTGTSGEGVPHGLGAKPQFIIVKRIDTTGAWTVYTQAQIATSNASKFFEMHNTDAEASNSNRWNGWQPDTVNFYIGTASETNASGGTYVAYVFAHKPGFSKSGRYTGSGGADGAFIYTGFAPKFVVFKQANTTGNWALIDGTRTTRNVGNHTLAFNSSNQESQFGGGENEFGADNRVDLLSNGIKIRSNSGYNNTGSGDYLYLAFGQTMVGTNGVPATAK